MPGVEKVKAAIGEPDPVAIFPPALARSGKLVPGGRRCGPGKGDDLARAGRRRSDLATTAPAAMFASPTASPGTIPPASAAPTVAMTVSPAPETSKTSSVFAGSCVHVPSAFARSMPRALSVTRMDSMLVPRHCGRRCGYVFKRIAVDACGISEFAKKGSGSGSWIRHAGEVVQFWVGNDADAGSLGYANDLLNNRWRNGAFGIV